jgi:hypothetical protein
MARKPTALADLDIEQEGLFSRPPVRRGAVSDYPQTLTRGVGGRPYSRWPSQRTSMSN